MRTDPCLIALANRKARETTPNADPMELIAEGKVGTFDPSGEKWIRDMADVGVDVGVNLITDFAGGHGWVGDNPALSIEAMHEEYAAIGARYPGKFFNVAGVNPHRRDAPALLERSIKEWGAVGLKLLPYTGFYPDDQACYKLYEKCLELGIPVFIHTGSAFMGYAKYARPMYIEQPAKDFPKLEFIMAHAGGGIGHLWEEACTVGRSAPNVHLELAQYAPTVIKGGFLGSKGKYRDHTAEFLDVLDIMRNMLPGGCQNIIFGSDYPTYPLETYKAWCELFLDLPAVAASHGYDFSQEEADLMCYQNAIRLLNLDIDDPSSPVDDGRSDLTPTVSSSS